MLIGDLDQTVPDEANKIRRIARKCAAAWGWDYYTALDYVLIDIDRRVCKETGVTFRPNTTSCEWYERGKGNE